ncbi:hypothetical protein ACFWBB_37405 [Streptomyces sp. NPDC060000]|uniref:hypothetical protein n=1 Tax=Streptomyces sp. NPDC060000 TaxID=3347031 RepID=UPI0036BC6269
MGLSQGRRAALRERANAFGFGQGRRTYAVTGVMGGLAQLARRALVGLAVFLIGALVVLRPPSAFIKGAVITAVMLAGFGLMPAWRRASATLEINRCCLYPGGMVVTNQFGQIRDAVAWAEVTTTKRMSARSILMAFDRVELGRPGPAPLTFVVLGREPALIRALQQELARNGIR